MKIKITAILGIIGLFILVNAGLVLSEGQSNEPNTQWVWGGVVNLDAQNKTLSLKYLDYETDQEKEITIMVDSLTSYENFKSLDEIQPKDTLSIDYILSDGKNIAKSISLEKPESAPVAPNPDAGVATPEGSQPSVATLRQEPAANAEKPETTTQAP